MTRYAVHLHVLLLQKDVVTYLQHADGAIELGTHEVGEVELICSRADEERTTFCQARHRLAADVVVRHQAAAIRIAFEGFVEELAIYLAHIDRHAQHLLVLLEETDPGVDVGGAVVAMHHCDQRAVGRRHEVDGLVGFAQRLLQNNHREGRSAGRDVACALLHGVGCHHASACVAFRGTQGNAWLQAT